MSKRISPLSLALLLLWGQPLFACWPSPESAALISSNREISQTYVWYNLSLAVAIVITRCLRSKLAKSAYVLFASLAALIALSPGWHYEWRRGDCGSMSVTTSQQIFVVLGFLLLWQLGFTIYQFWQSRFG